MKTRRPDQHARPAMQQAGAAQHAQQRFGRQQHQQRPPGEQRLRRLLHMPQQRQRHDEQRCQEGQRQRRPERAVHAFLRQHRAGYWPGCRLRPGPCSGRRWTRSRQTGCRCAVPAIRPRPWRPPPPSAPVQGPKCGMTAAMAASSSSRRPAPVCAQAMKPSRSSMASAARRPLPLAGLPPRTASGPAAGGDDTLTDVRSRAARAAHGGRPCRWH